MSFNKIIFQREAAEKDYGVLEDMDSVIMDDAPEGEVDKAPTETEPAKPDVTAPIEEVKKPDAVIDDTKPVDTNPTDVIPPVEQEKPDWKKLVKEVDKYEVLKEAGFDDFEIDMLKYKEKTGDLTPYLAVKTVDYAKWTPEQLLRADLAKQNVGMSEKALEFKLKKEFESKYYTNRDDYPEDSDEAIYGAEQLRLDSDAKRKQFIEEQATFKAPEPKADPDASRKAEEFQQRQEKQKSFVIDNPITKTLLTAKEITIGQGEGSFTFPISDPQQIINEAVKAASNADAADMSPEQLQKFFQVMAIGQNVAAFTEGAIQHGRSLGVKKVADEIQNIIPPDKKRSEAVKAEKDYSVRYR